MIIIILQALHRFVPLPALSSNILRIICDDDLEVAHEEDEAHSASLAAADAGQDENERITISSGPRMASLARAALSCSSSSDLAGAAVPKYSPLTRRLSKTPIKPRIEINLAPSPQYQKKLLGHDQLQHEPVSNNEFDPSHDDRAISTGPSISRPATARELRTE